VADQGTGAGEGTGTGVTRELPAGMSVVAVMTWLAWQTHEAVTQAQGVASWDQPLLDTMAAMRSSWSSTAVTAFTHLGGVILMPLLAITTMAALAVRRRSWTPVVLISAAGIGSLLMTIAAKDLTGRMRPPLTGAVPPYEHSASFPSGHSLNALVIAGVAAYLLVLRRRSRRSRILTVTVAAVFALAMGLSRVYLGHHWPTDVLAAWALGLGWLAAIITAHRLYLTAQRQGRHTRSAMSRPRSG
jgi:membrane-associated phospholipid phosphatase